MNLLVLRAVKLLRFPSGWVRFWRGCRIEEKAVLCLAALVVPFYAGFEYSTRQSKLPLPPLFRPSPGESASSHRPRSARRESGFLLVHVAGKVKRPGLQKLPAGSRIFEAIQASGGTTDVAASNALNLAARVQDGEKIVVGILPQAPANREAAGVSVSRPESASQSHPTAKRKALPASPININTASAQELEALPGVGPAIAGRIVAARQASRFNSLSDLDRVKGIGPRKLEQMRPYTTF